ncbi:Dnah2 [Symbiodinium sp. CCMP2592]|nr:Dnah2 [Symbiodinium sp. CCMP2592]
MTGKLLQKHPNFPKEMTLLKSFDTIKDISQKTFENSAEFQMEAENVDEEDMHDAMEALMDQEMPQAPTDGNVPPPNPKPREPKKAKKEKTWRDKAQDADKRANKEIIEYEGFKQASHMKAAIMADVDPAKCDLEKVKTKVAIAIGQKLPEDSMKSEPRATAAAADAINRNLGIELESDGDESSEENVALATHMCDPRFKSLGEGRQSAKAIVENAYAAVQDQREAGNENVSPVTARVAKMYNHKRRYWNHFRSRGVGWAVRHPADEHCIPISVYGDEAQFTKQGDSFLALMFTFTLHKCKGEPWKKNFTYFVVNSFYCAGEEKFVTVATGEAMQDQPSDLAHAGVALSHMLRLQGRMPSKLHIDSHTGHAFNDLADCVAKHFAHSSDDSMVPTSLVLSSSQAVLPWLAFASNMCRELPHIQEDGILAAGPSQDRPTPITLAQCHQFTTEQPAQLTKVDMRIATYNCLTVATVLQRESLDAQFDAAGLCVVGLQETRAPIKGRSATARFHVLASEAQAGQDGCQVWLSKTVPVAHDNKGAIYWDPGTFAIVWATPRVLVVTARAASLKFAFISAHALTSKASEQACRAWWSELQSALRRAPSDHFPVLMVDANAHFAWQRTPPALPNALNSNAEAFSQLLDEQQLVASANVTPAGDRVESWIGPLQQPKCLDFIACPASIHSGLLVQGCLVDFRGQSDFDHRPVTVRIRFRRHARRQYARPRLDTKAMLTPAGRARLRQIYDCLPHFPWHLPVDQHLRALNEHLMKALLKAFPAQNQGPRSPVIQASTWQLVCDRRSLRRDLHALSLQRRQRLLANVFGAWAHRTTSTDTAMDMYEALLVTQLRDLSVLIRRQTRADATEAARLLIKEARTQGPEQLYRAFRSVLRQGRRYRPPALCPSIEGADGHSSDPYLKLGRNFAKAERALECTADDIHTRAAPAADAFLEVDPGLSLSALAHGYGNLQSRRAAGVSGIPPEALSGDALGAAMAHFPLLLKTQAHGTAPALWRGGRAVAIPKPSKNPSTLEGWRSIILHEASMKGVCKALRAPLVQCLETHAQRGNAADVLKTHSMSPWRWPKGSLALPGMLASTVRFSSLTVVLHSMPLHARLYLEPKGATPLHSSRSSQMICMTALRNDWRSPQLRLAQDFYSKVPSPHLFVASSAP